MNTTKQLDLRGLSEAERNHRVDIAVSRVLCGFKAHECNPFSTNPMMVIPLLPKEMFGKFWTADGGYLGVRICIRFEDTIVAEGHAETFALAACIALLRARGIEVLL